MKKAMKWIVLILVVSGWVAFAVKHAVSEKEKAHLQVRIAELESEIGSYRFIVKDVESSSEKISSIISTLGNLQIDLDKLKAKMEKGANHESSQDRE
jgi:peptidoglycan hydrolase CwlO-like protein